MLSLSRNRLFSFFLSFCVTAPAVFGQASNIAFRAPRAYFVAGYMTVVGIGDFNGDKRDDLAIGGQSGEIQVMLNTGNGLFERAVAYPLPGYPIDVQAGDFNGDQKLDLAITTSAGISILLGNGDGTFQPAITTAGLGGNFALGDFNHDGKLDLAEAAGSVEVYLGNGDGTFQSPISLNVETSVGSIVAADFNGDHRIDLAVGGGAEVVVLLGFGNGNFGAAREYATDANVLQLTAGDVNRDGIEDIVAIVSGGYSVLLGDTNRTFKQGSTGVLSSPVSAVLRDFNGDQILDLVSVTQTPGYLDALDFDVQILLGQGDGTFGRAASFSAGNGAAGGSNAVAAGVFTASGDLGIAVANPGANGAGGGAYVLMGDGKGSFVQAANYGNEGPAAAAVADFNRDGFPDVAQYNGVAVTLFTGDGSKQFQTGASYTVTPAGGIYSPLISAVDLNNDGVPDIITSAGGPDTNIEVLLGNGDGTFQGPLVQSIGNGAPSFVGIGDFNGDGFPDLAFAVSDSPDVWVLLGNGDGTFGNAVLYRVGHWLDAVTVADFNGDGKLDIAAADTDGFAILLGNGDGTFQPAVSYSGASSTSVYAADLNGDRVPDLVFGGVRGGGVVGVALNNGDGTFGSLVTYGVGSGAAQLALGDFNGDGTIDIAAEDSLANDVHILSGNGDGTFVRERSSFQTTGAPGAIVAGDMNNNGKLDLVISVLPAFDILYNSSK